MMGKMEGERRREKGGAGDMVQAGAGSGLGAGREAGGWVITAHENMGGI